MPEYPERKCAHCNNAFTPRRKDQMYCKAKCTYDAFQKRKASAQLGLPMTTVSAASSSVPAPIQRSGFEPLPFKADPASEYVIRQQERAIVKLEDLIEKKDQKIEELTQKKTDLESEVRDLKAEVDKKPSALGSLAQPENLVPIISAVPGILKELRETVSAAAASAPQPQIAGPQNPIMQWLSSQPLSVQNAFSAMIEKLSQIRSEQTLVATIEWLTRQQNVGSGYSSGYGNR